jgi:hypothetical protein
MKELLLLLLERNYGIPTLSSNVNKLLTYDESQLEQMLFQGVRISDEINLSFTPGNGFKCWNEGQSLVGTLPITGVIERKLNRGLIKS